MGEKLNATCGLKRWPKNPFAKGLKITVPTLDNASGSKGGSFNGSAFFSFSLFSFTSVFALEKTKHRIKESKIAKIITSHCGDIKIHLKHLFRNVVGKTKPIRCENSKPQDTLRSNLPADGWSFPLPLRSYTTRMMCGLGNPFCLMRNCAHQWEWHPLPPPLSCCFCCLVFRFYSCFPFTAMYYF